MTSAALSPSYHAARNGAGLIRRDRGLGAPLVQHDLDTGIIREGDPETLAKGRLVVGHHDEPASRRSHASQ